jgi:ribulose-phosphate 3-epimerase
MLLYPSTMCFDIGNIKKEIKDLEEAGVDGFHMDIMDGNYVPNYALGLNEYKYIRENTKLTLDAHLMVNNPESKIDFFAELGCEIFYFHPDNVLHPVRVIDGIKEKNMKAGIVINPDLEIGSVKSLLSLVDYVLVMTVTPGFAGQAYLEFVNEKIIELMDYKDKFAFKVFVDGAISKERLQSLDKMGVDGFVLGTSALFNKNRPYKEIIEELRRKEA